MKKNEISIELTILNTDELVPNNENPRTLSKKEKKKLIKSIKDSTWMMDINRIKVDENNLVLAGNQRLMACKELGIKEIPVQINKGFTKEQKEEYIIKDNTHNGVWDEQALQTHYEIETLNDWGVDTKGWKIIDKNKAEEDDFEIPTEIKSKIKPGDLIEIGQHRLLCGSSTEEKNWEKLVGKEAFDMVLTDPPYNVDYTGKTKDSLKIENDKKTDSDFYQFLFDFYSSLGGYVKPGGAWYIWHADSEGANFRKAMSDSGIMVKQCLIWVKNSIVMGRQDYHWKHEPCLYGWKEGASHNWYTDRKQTTILEFDRPTRNAEHPTMKPIPLLAYQIKNSSKEDDLIADAFLGSGSTMVAAHQLNRRCYGMELDPKYCQVIVDRMLKLDDSLEIKKNGKKWNVKAN